MYLEVQEHDGSDGESEHAAQNDELGLEGDERTPHEGTDRADALPELEVTERGF